jgi:hypothetical protein
MRAIISVFLATWATIWLLISPPPSAGQSKTMYRAPRTAEGVPDLTGTWFTNATTAAWDVEEHPAGLGIPAGPSIIIDPKDGKIPYQPWGLAKRQDLIEHHAYDDPQAHCYASGVPRVNYAPFGFQIHQNKGMVVMAYENFHLFRFIPTTPRPKLPDHIKLFMGQSRGRWEGDTLVVEVTNQNGRTWLDMASNFTTPNLHVVERWTRTGPDELSYQATLTDPTLYTRPWTIAFTLRREPDPNYELLELACWEGEQDLVHYPEDQGAPKRK